MTGDVSESAIERGTTQRARQIAFALSAIGLFFNALFFILYLMDEGFNAFLFVNFLFYTAVLAAIALSCHRDWHHRTVAAMGVMAIYFHMWATTLYESHIEQGSYLNIPIIFFMPFCLVLVSTYRTLVVFAAAQSAFVYIYSKYYLARDLGVDFSTFDSDLVAVLFATVSGIALFELAWVLRSRQRAEMKLENLVRETKRLAAEDPLTGLQNRRAFMHDVETRWNDKQPFVVLFIDLDRFKPINDRYGHAIGDMLLRTVARRLLSSARLEACSRLGGDEFAAILPVGSNDQIIEEVLMALHTKLTSKIETETGCIEVGASIGYARSLMDGSSVSELLHAADLAMMRVKRDGGGVAAFNRDFDEMIRDLQSTLTEQRRRA